MKNKIIKISKSLFKNNSSSKIINNHLKSSNQEKKSHAEFATPFILRNDMLNLIPNSFWKNPGVKVFEPCAGKGQFVIDIIKRFMDGLKDFNKIIDGVKVDLRNPKKRYKYILKNIIYFADINKQNILIIKLLLDPDKKYDKIINSNLGDTLSESFSPEKTFGIKGFDAVIGNPPYNMPGKTKVGITIFQDFIIKSLNEWILPNGYLLFVTPPAWRKPISEKSKFVDLYKLMTQDNYMKFLSIHDMNDGKKLFNAGTRFDYYLIQKKNPVNKQGVFMKTKIIDQDGIEINKALNELPWIPNNDFEFVFKLLAGKDEDKLSVIYNRSAYARDNSKIISDKKDKTFKYKCVHSTKIGGPEIVYSSSNERGHFGIPKVILSIGSFETGFIDKEGEFCMTDNTFGIPGTQKNMKEILSVFKSDKMKKLKKDTFQWSQFAFEYPILNYFKKDFYKYF